MKVAIYNRFSSDNQREASIEDQQRVCRRRAEGEGWTITATFADAAMSGSVADRPRYQAMLAAAGRKEFDILLLEDLSRLTRDSVEQEQTLRRLEFHGTRVIGVSDGYDSNSKSRKLHRGMRGMLNEVFLDDLRDKTHRGLAGQAAKGFWCGGKPYGYNLKPILDHSQRDAYGNPLRVATQLEVNHEQAAIVAELYQRYIDGESARAIAAALNARGVPSSGSTWRRKVRRCSGWVGSAVRAILVNDLYTGTVSWNTSQFVRDPDTGKHKRRARPRSEWHVFRDAALRIVSDETCAAAHARTRTRANSDERLKAGGKAKFLLSGLLKCTCGSNLIMDDRAYQCGGARDGGCGHKVRIRRDHAEQVILDPIREGLLAPERVARMASEMAKLFAERMRQATERADAAPAELQALDERIARLRARLAAGDADMEPDEIQAAIDRAEAKRTELLDARPAARESAKVLAFLPKAADAYRRQIAAGLDNDPRAAAKARVTLRKLCGGPITIESDADGSVWARFELHPAALLSQAAGTDGRGSRI